ncbi:MAG: putative lipid a export atp-binding/permease msba [Pseudomonadota bacterium]|jgi:subfamily B ATP-binding cassette protein MsbA
MVINPYISKILSLLKPHKYKFILSVVCMAIVAVSEGLIPKIVKDLLDKGFNNHTSSTMFELPLMIIGLAFFRAIGHFGSQYYTSFISQRIAHNLRCNMFNHITYAPMQSIAEYQSASLINIVIFEVLQILGTLSNVLMTIVRDSITLIVLLSYLLWINWQLALVVSIILPPIALMVNAIKKRLKKLNKLQHEFTNDSAYQVEQVFKNIKIVKSYNAQAYENSKFHDLSQNLERFSMKIAIAGGLNQPITQMLASIALAVVIGVAVFQASQHGTTVGEFTSFIMGMLLIISPLKRLADVHQPLQRSLNACEHIFKILELPNEQQNKLIRHNDNKKQESNNTFDISNKDIGVSIDINHLTVKYGDAIAINNLSLKIPVSKHTAIVGVSGSGKSTLLQVLLGFVEPAYGEININTYKKHNLTTDNEEYTLEHKINIKDIDIQNLREYIAYIGQEICIFNRSIADNIAYGGYEEIESNADIKTDKNIERINFALKQAYLFDFVQTLPDGINTIIGDSGSKLSGGQRQRLSLARAFYKNAPIIILDEATSALDAQSEEQVQLALAKLMQSKTIISVAHRLHTITNADNIVVMHNAQIVEQGTHQELLTQNSHYANLHKMM